MKNREQEFEWHDLKDMWVNSSQTRDIHIKMSDLLDELKGKTSQFEKDSIKGDLAALKANWTEFKEMTSQYERDSVKNDLAIITKLLNKFFNLFRKK